MVKTSLTMIPVLILFIAGTSFNSQENISIDQDVPANVTAGDVFTVNLSIHKSLIEGAARLQQDLPEGFVAEEMVTQGADFIFEDHSVKFIWTKLPKENDFVISYRIKSDKNITGQQSIGGVFVYLKSGKTERFNLTPAVVNFQTGELTSYTPTVTRKLITVAPENGEYTMELTIRPNNISQKALFTDEIPLNYTAEVIDAQNAAVSVEKGSIIFNWQMLPSKDEFKIAYSVKSGKPGPSPVINGYFTYGNSYDDQQESKQIRINEVSPSEIIMPSPNQDQTADAGNEGMPLTPGIMLDNSSPLAAVAEKGISFKVQISATQKSNVKNNQWFNSMYHIDSNVEMTYHEGWKKYITGNFTNYAEATAFKNKTQEKIPDAFVVAYENGIRIPVNDAIRNKSINQ